MGGRSSKSRKNELRLSVHESQECPLNCSSSSQQKYSKNSPTKKKSTKNSVKIKTDKKSAKKKKTISESQTADHSLIEDTAVSEHLVPNSPVYRKKSSCPSCEAKDILLGKNRSRSGSERSLRFSDFNKVLRRTKIYEWETTPLDVPLDGVSEPIPEDVCYVCGVYTGYHVRICRVCLKAYHDGCLLKIGHPLTEKSRRLIGCKQWSCHQCVALNHLLTQEEVRGALEDLEDLDISKDQITEADYLNFCKQSLTREGKIFTSEKEASSLTRFRLVAKSGFITWTDFLNMESIRILNKRNKDSLVHLLTQSEIAEARKAFKLLDKKEMGMISKSEVQHFFDSKKTRVSSYFPDDSMIYIDEDLDSPVTWGEFLRDRAIYFLGQRPNLMKVINCSSSDDNLHKENITISYDSMDDDDEDYTLCLSEVDQADHHHSCDVSQPDQVLVDSSKENQVRASVNKTMLDDINVELEKCHKLQEMQAESAGMSQTADNCTSEGIGIELGNQNEGKLKSQNIRSSRLTPERFESTLYNDSLHTTIPWDNLGDRSPKKNQEEKQLHRRSEIITRKQVKPSQARAVSQVGCKAGKNVMAPAYGNLVGRVHNGEWGF